MNPALRLNSLEPTIFFVSEKGALRQLARLSLENSGDTAEVWLHAQLGDWQTRLPLGAAPSGRSQFDLYLPDIPHSQPMFIELWSGEVLQDTLSIDWQPQKKWEVHLAHYSHHDLGYTDIPSHVIAEQVGFLDDVLRFCEETEHWPDESKFRWLVEQSFSIVEYVENRPPETVDRLMKFIRNGQIEVTALFGNQTLELCSHEELARLLYPAFRLKSEYGIEITSATHNDIPGFPWGLAGVLAAAGIRYFCPGVPSWYFGQGESRVHPLWDETAVLPMEMPGAFWWQAPDGARILLWYNLHGMEWYPTSYAHILEELPAMLQRLDALGYGYDQVLYTVRGGHRDNAPPTLRAAYLAHEWNSHWTYPRLITSTHRQFLEKFERRYGASLKTLRGDVPGTDYPAAAACTPKETAVNRGAHDWMMTGEKLATMASLNACGAPDRDYPKAAIDQAYRNIFYYDEHCWGMWQPGGPALDGDWSEKSAYAYRGAAIAHDIVLKAANRLADAVAYPQDAYYITVFNPLSWERSDIVRVPLRTLAGIGNPMYWAQPTRPGEGAALVSGSAIGRSLVNPPESLFAQPFELLDVSAGTRVPYQLTSLADFQAAQPWAAERFAMGKVDPAYLTELVFLAEGLPPMGYKTYRVAPCERWPEFSLQASTGSEHIENRFYQLKFDPHTGVILSMLDRDLGREILDPLAPHSLGQLVIRQSETGQESTVEFAGWAIAEHGPVYTSLKRKGQALGCPQCSQEIILYHGLQRVDLNTRLLRDAQPMLEGYIAFPFKVEAPTFHFESAGTVIEPIRDQLPGTNTDYYAVQHWVDVSGSDWGIAWTPLDAHMAEFGGLWPGYVSGAHHGVTPPGYGHPFLQPGELTKGYIYSLAMYNNFRTNFLNVHPGDILLRYSFTTHPGDWRSARVWQSGWNAMNPPYPVWMKGPRTGSQQAQATYCQVDAPNVNLFTIKRAENGEGLIFRMIEMIGKPTNVSLTLPFCAILHAYETNPIEENQRLLPHTAYTVHLTMKPHSMTTVRIIPNHGTLLQG